MNGTAPQAKGSTLQATLEFVRAEFGIELLDRAFAQVSADVRAAAGRAAATDEVDYDHLVELWKAIDGVVAPTDPEWMERAGAYSIGQRGTQLYGGILRKKDPTEFLTQSVSLFRLYYHPGDMEVVERDSTRAVLRLLGFEARTSLFCRRQTGGLTQAIEIAGGEQAAARHVRCALEGDAFCEWELTWSAGEKLPRD